MGTAPCHIGLIYTYDASIIIFVQNTGIITCI